MDRETGSVSVTIEVDGTLVSKEDVETAAGNDSGRLQIEKAVKQCLDREIWHMESVQALLSSLSVKR